MGPLSLDFYLPAFPRISADLHASASAIQLSLTTTLIGLAVGQMIFGALSDRLGRRPPLLGGLAVFVIASAACALAPNIETLLTTRFVQGLAGAAGMVTALAMVRDRFAGAAAARIYSTLFLVTSLGPIVGPQLGAALLSVASWRVLFIALAGAGCALLALSAAKLPETLRIADRRARGLRNTVRALRSVCTDRRFFVFALTSALATGATFAYLSGSSFVLQDVYGATPQEFGLIFALNAIGLLIGSQANGRLVLRFGPAALLAFGVVVLATSTCLLLLVTIAAVDALAWVVAFSWVAMCSIGFIVPNASALALADFSHAAGTASSLLGVLRYGWGAAIAPLVGLAGVHTARPMALLMAVFGAAAGLSLLGLRWAPASVPTADTTPSASAAALDLGLGA
jgi:DHA1 family bicyclomycin/chloramphenicol resistance-like MFS transporter